MKASQRSLGALLIFVAVPVAVALVLIATLDRTFAAALIASIRDASHEWWAVPLFLAAYALCALLLLPVAPLSIAAALAWGWKVGGAIELVACTLGALPPFLLARRGTAVRFLERRGVVMPRFSDDRGVFPLFLLRIVPVIPYVALNYIAGLGRFRLRDYILTVLVGSVPSVFLFAWFVDTLGAAATGMATQVRILAACIAFAVAAIIGRAAALRVRRMLWSEARTVPPPDDGGRRSASSEPPPE
ncbi:MAG TPA: VTT domain-containing protein [Thermoanaerobaculia bacterium]|nr:VTT domain-containing protein [Thermoanaerobaculia bacterium]